MWGSGLPPKHTAASACVRLVVGLLLFGSTLPAVFAQVVLNEVMFDPAGSEYYDEFVELLNIGGDTLNLAGWQIGDDLELDQIVDAGEGLLLAPGQFALVLDPGYFEHSTSYDSLIPDSALLVTIDDGAFGKGGFSNTDPETVCLVNAVGDTVGAYRYTLGNPPGFSDEKIDAAGGDATDNWANSRVYLGTPGFANSVARKEIDLALQVVGPETLVVPKPQEVALTAVIRNVGKRTSQGGTVRFWWDRNGNGEPEKAEVLNQTLLSGLASNDSVRVGCRWIPPGRGLFRLLADCRLSGDEEEANDRDSTSVIVRCPRGQVVINEIYYRPAVGEPEWVELYNTGSDSVSLAGFWLSDGTRRGTVQLGLAATRKLFAPRGYTVLCENRDFPGFAGLAPWTVLVPENGFPSLNNSGDEVVVRDALGTSVDSVRYRASWGGENGVSLERILPQGSSNAATNWGSCVAEDGATPGRKNSLSPPDRNLSAVLNVESGRCARPGQSVDVRYVVQNTGLTSLRSGTTALWTIRLCNSADTVYLRRATVPALAPLDTFVVSAEWVPSAPGWWEIGARVLLREDSLTASSATARVWVEPQPMSLVINEIQYNPPSGESEWVEIYNVGSQALSLNNWWFGDARRRVVLDSLPRCLGPGDYALILPREAEPPAGTPASVPVWHVRGSWPGLSNGGDAVVLGSPCAQVVDSLFYRPFWGQGNGSLERILADGNSTDSTNWANSVDPAGATPGRLNSATPREVDLAIRRVEARGLRVAEAGTVRVSVANVGRTPVSAASLTLSLANGGGGTLGKGGVPALSPDDTVDVQVLVEFREPGWVSLMVHLACPGDARPENDSWFVRCYVSPPFEALSLNELYVAALPGQAEWVEVANTSPWEMCLRGWGLQDTRGPEGGGQISDSVVVRPAQILILAADSSVAADWALSDSEMVVPLHWPGFNDDGDLIRLVDPAGRVVDSLQYQASWGVERGYSLEKLRPELSSVLKANWTRSTAPEGGTPAKPNSVYAYAVPSEAALAVNPNPFSPDGDGHEDVAVFSLRFPGQVVTARLRIFDVVGRRVRQLLANEPCGPQRLVVWDGRDDLGRLCRVGPYVAFLEWQTSEGRTGTARAMVVLAW